MLEEVGNRLVGTVPNPNEISVTRALAELKTLDARITKASEVINPVALVQAKKKINNYLTIEDFNKTVQSNFDSFKALVKRKERIKTAIAESNVKTVVNIGDVNMTVSDAIVMKETVKYKKDILKNLTSKLNGTKVQLDKNMQAVEKMVETAILTELGSDKELRKKEDEDMTRKRIIDNNNWEMVDPLKVETVIANLEKEITDYELNVDFVLSESNALTKILI